MPPKKKDKKEDPDKKKNAQVTEVDKVFFELQMADCNRKLARLRSAVDEYEQRNEELQKAYDTLDEDRADIIAFLKKTLNQKNEENSELKEKVKGLEEAREIETKDFHDTVTELEKNFNFMKDQLSSENKLMAGKLNTLEEFRAIRDDLMKKFETQEREFEEQEVKYKKIIYDAEKKFVIAKDKLKKEMEARLLQLAQDFQDATELRIAASTHRVIRENIAINNELDTILKSQTKLAGQSEKLKENERAARVAKELAQEERDKAINKNVVQLKVINQLTKALEGMKKEMALTERKNFDIEKLQLQLSKVVAENDSLTLQVQKLEQNLHANMCTQSKSLVEADKVLNENTKLRNILKEAAVAIQASLKINYWATEDPTREILDRQVLLSRLLEIITQYQDLQGESAGMEASLGKVYKEGDLGFISKIQKKKTMCATFKTELNKEDIKVERHQKSITGSVSSSTYSPYSSVSIVDSKLSIGPSNRTKKGDSLHIKTKLGQSKTETGETIATDLDSINTTEKQSLTERTETVNQQLHHARSEPNINKDHPEVDRLSKTHLPRVSFTVIELSEKVEDLETAALSEENLDNQAEEEVKDKKTEDTSDDNLEDNK